MNIFDTIKKPKVIFETESDYNGKIKIIDVGQTRKLQVDHIDQSLSLMAPSVERLYWGMIIDVLKKQKPNFENCLMLGLGGGTLAHLLSRNFNQPELVSIEIDQVMADIAKDYFDLDKVPNHKVIVEDALRVVVDPTKYGLETESFDVLIVDILNGEKYPDLGKSGNFVSAIKSMVRTGGIILFNRIYTEHHQEDVNNFMEFLEEFFDDVDFETVAGYTNSDNVIIYGIVTR